MRGCLCVREAIDAHFLQRGGHLGDLVQVLQTLVAPGPFAEGPEVGEDVAGDTSTLVGHADYYVLRGLADCDFDGGRDWRGAWAFLLLLHDGLDGVA